MINFLKLSVLTKNGKHLRKHETVVCCNIGHWFGVTQKVGRHHKILILYQNESCLIHLLLVRRPYCEIQLLSFHCVITQHCSVFFSLQCLCTLQCSVLLLLAVCWHTVVICHFFRSQQQIPATSIILIHCIMHFYYFVK